MFLIMDGMHFNCSFFLFLFSEQQQQPKTFAKMLVLRKSAQTLVHP